MPSRPPRSAPPRPLRLALAAAVAAAFLSACVDMDATLVVNPDSTARLHAAYSISTLAYPLFEGVSGTFAVNPPLSRKDLDSIAARIAGMKITAYSQVDDARSHSYDYALDFASLDALCSFLRLTAGSAAYAAENGRKKISLEIPSLGTVTDPELVSRLDVLFGGDAVRLVATLPAAVQSAPAAKVDGRTATFQANVVDFVKYGKNLEWVLSW